MIIKDRILTYTKTIGDDTIADQWLRDGVKDVVSRYLTNAPTELYQFATNQQVTDQGLTLESRAPILDVLLGDYSCAEIQPAYRKKAADEESIYYATATSPVFWRLNEKLYIQPTPAASSDTATLTVVNTHADGTEFTCSEVHQYRPGDTIVISGVGNGAAVDGEGVIIDCATAFNKTHIVSSITGNSSFTIPVTFLDNFVLSGASATRPSAYASIVKYDNGALISDSSIDAFPEELIHVVVLYVACVELSRQMLLTKDKMPTDLDSLTGILGTADVASIFEKLKLDKTSIPLPTTEDGSTPVIRDVVDYFSTYVISDAGHTGLADTTLEEWIALYTDEIDVATTGDLAKLKAYIEDDEDPELAGAKIQEIQVKMGKISTELQNATTKYTMHLQSIADEDRALAASLQQYQLDVQNAMQEWSTEWAKREKLWTMKVQKHMQDYQFISAQLQYVMQKYEKSFASITTGAA